MSDTEFDWEETEDQGIPNGPKVLRDLVDKQKQELKNLGSEMEALRSRVREAELSKAFAEKGLPTKALKLFPKDIEPTEDKITEWVSEYGDLFGVGGSQEAKPAEPMKPAEVVTPEVQEQFTQMSQMTSGATPGSSSAMDDLTKALSNPHLQDEMSFDDWKNLLKRAGGKV